MPKVLENEISNYVSSGALTEKQIIKAIVSGMSSSTISVGYGKSVLTNYTGLQDIHSTQPPLLLRYLNVMKPGGL